MLDGLRRFAVNNNNGKRSLISSPYSNGRFNGTTASISAEKSKQQQELQRGFESTAFGMDASSNSMGGFSGAMSVVAKNISMGMLEDFLPNDRHIRNKIFRDIYYHDAVGGGAVDIYATLPWSDFYLTGLRDREALDVYHKSIESMRLKILLPAITRDYLALGVFIGSTVFDERNNIFSAVMPQNVDFCDLIEVPIYGMDPLITLKVPEATRKLFSDAKDPRAARILNSLPDHMAEGFKGGAIPLEPESTLYIPRRTLSSDSVGTSYFERILPVHLMEKALFKGSIDQAYRRQRSILHITMGGDGDDYVPSQTDMESQRDLWLAADTDPTGAIIITRTGVQPNEVRDAASFWRIDEVFDFLVTAKYRALSINEAFITGDANYNSMDASMSVFIEQMRSFRSMLTQEIFYEKIFPAIALANDFTKEQYQVLASTRSRRNLAKHFNGTDYITSSRTNGQRFYQALCRDTRHGLNFHDKNIDINELAIPHVVWQKHLRPEGDQTYFDLLSSMQDKGIPVPMAAMAMAGGMDIHTILNSMDEEIKLRRKLKKYQDKLAEFKPEQADDGGDDGGGGGGGREAQARAIESLAALVARPGINRPVGLFNREFDPRLLPHYQKKDGSYSATSGKGQRQIYEKIAKRLSRVMADKAATANRQAKRQQQNNGNRKPMVHARLGVIK